MNRHYLIFDIGTGNSRICLTEASGKIIDIEEFENSYIRDHEYEDALYFLPADMKERLFAGTKSLLDRNPDADVAAVTAASARETIILIDKDGVEYYGLPNIDNRGTKWLKDIPDHERISRISGRWVSNIFSVSKLVGLREVHPELYDRVCSFTSLSEWIGYLFTGKLAIEHSMAGESQLFDVEKREWSSELCRYFGIDENILPPLCVGGEVLGTVKKELCEELSLREDTVFIAGGADTQTAVKGANAKEGEVVIVSGTTSPVVTIRKEPYFDPKVRCWTDCNIDGKTYQMETNAGVSGMNYQRMKHLFFDDVTYETLDEKMSEKKEFHCIASFGTLIFAENRFLSRGGFLMQAPLDEEVDRYDFAYALIADIACSIVQQYQSLEEMIPNENGYILGCGGGFQSKVLCRMIASLSGKDLIIRGGFRQASVQGCVRICNEYFGQGLSSEGEETVYRSEPDAILDAYYAKWKEARDMFNR